MINWIRRVASNLVPTTLAGRAAAATFVLVAVIVTLAVASMYHRADKILQPFQAMVIAAIAATIPVWVYIGVKIWGREEESRFPDIDNAWQAGIDALDHVGLAPSNGTVPFFLVLGGGNVEDAFVQSMRASGEMFRVTGVPAAADVTPALRWYASDSGTYLFCSGVGALGSLVDMWSNPANEAARAWGESIAAGEINSTARSASARQRIMTSVGAIDIQRAQLSESATNLPAAPHDRPAGHLPINVDYADQAERLAYLCRMIKRARRPRCAINGAVAILPFDCNEASNDEVGAIVSSIQKDVRVIHRTLCLRFPINGLVVGMERAKGFNEFSRLLGAANTLKRLGEKFDVFRRTNPERIQVLTDRICERVEEFVYLLFSWPAALDSPAENRKLYRFLCQMRRQIKPKLCQLLTSAFARGDRRDLANAFENGDEPPAYFSGCYLASTGIESDEQAFVKGLLFDKLVAQQGKVEWTPAARRNHFRFKIAVIAGWAITVCLAIGLLLGSLLLALK